MNASRKLGQVFGIDLYVHWTFLLLPAWVLLSSWGAGGPQLVLFLLAFVGAVFGCVVLHELGHALMARRFGIGTRDITLYPIGGVASLQRMSEKPAEELAIALAGPAVNVVIAAALGAGLALGGAVFAPEELFQFAPGRFLGSLLVANVLLVGFNLIPAFPMDGGRVLRALLSMKLGHLRATEIAVNVGLVAAVLMGVWGYFNGYPMLPVVSLFVLITGQQELMAVRRRAALQAAGAAEVPPADDDSDPHRAERGGERFTGFTWNSRYNVWVRWSNGRPVAIYPAGQE
jgi:Zn-dependent protease